MPPEPGSVPAGAAVAPGAVAVFGFFFSRRVVAEAPPVAACAPVTTPAKRAKKAARARAQRTEVCWIVCISFQALAGLADGLALKELRYAAMPRFAPTNWVPRSPRYVGGDSAEVGGRLANAKTETGAKAEILAPENGKGPLREPLR